MQALGYKNDKFHHNEPFKGLFTQGMVCHQTFKNNKNEWMSPDEVETEDGINFFTKDDKNSKVIVGPSESMSKSKKNTIDPAKMIDNYGADSVRLFILSDSPPEKDVQWSEQGMISSYKFLQKFWTLHKEIIKKIKAKKNGPKINDDSLSKFTNQTLKKIEKNLNNFQYNVIIANFYETYNFMSKIIQIEISSNILEKNYLKIITSMEPVIPHFSSQCLDDLNYYQKELSWPIIDAKFLESEEVTIVVQINGKKRSLINVKIGLNEDEVLELAKKHESIKKHLNNKKIIKNIYIKDKLINLII
jgi:leucyl-tRNA synthetase